MAKKSSDPQTLAFAQHDHGACAADALDYARGVCAQQGLRLTPVRERVLQLLLESHSALGAYDLQAVPPGGGSPGDTGQRKTGAGREIDWL